MVAYLSAVASLYSVSALNIHPLLTAVLAHLLPYALISSFLLLTILFCVHKRWRLSLGLGLVSAGVFTGYVVNWFPPPSHQQIPDLTVLTFNVGARFHERNEIEDWLRTQDADLVLLQETYFAMDGIFAPETELLPYVQIQETNLGYRGVSLLSRFPILEIEGFEREQPFVRAVVELANGMQIAVYNVSLAAPFSAGNEDSQKDLFGLISNYTPEERNIQIVQLISRLRDETLPVLVIGDFNLTEYEPDYRMLIALPLVDAYRSIHQTVGATFPSGNGVGYLGYLPPLLRIDYILYGPHFTPISAELGPAIASDHLPVWASLVLNKGY